MKKIALIFSLIFLSQFCIANDKVKDQTVLIKDADQEMAAAISKAQATLDDFLRVSEAPPKGAMDFKLKVRISDKHGTEHMWVTPFKKAGSGFVGTLADEPAYVKNVVNGQNISFRRSDVSDWGYVQDGKQKGSFTVCVVFKHMPVAEVEKYRKDYGFEC